MRATALFSLLLLCACCCARVATRERVPVTPESVAAKRYKILYAESALDLSHGGAQLVDELFVPSGEAAAFLTRDAHFSPETSVFVEEWRAYAHHADAPRHDLTGITSEGFHPPSEIEDVSLPPDLAREIREYAELSERWQSEGKRLGARMAAYLGLALSDHEPGREQ